MVKKLSLSHLNLEIDEIAEQYHITIKSYNIFFSKDNPNYENDFFGMIHNDVRDKMRLYLSEINMLFSLSLLSAFEAKLRKDYLLRCEKRQKDNVSRKFRNVYKQKENKPKLIEDILSIWESCYPSAKNSISLFKPAYTKYRHWLAHGRYRSLKFNTDKYMFQDIYLIIDSIITNIPLTQVSRCSSTNCIRG